MGKRAPQPRLESEFVRGYRPSGLLNARVGRRAFLVGAAGSAVGASAVAKAAQAAGQAQVAVTGKPGGGVRVATVRVGRHQWVIDPRLFDGEARVTVESANGEHHVRLEGARLPGTQFHVAYTARVRPALGGPVLAIEFEALGVAGGSWSGEVPLEAWLRGDAVLGAALDRRTLAAALGGSAHPLASHAVAVAAGPGTVSFAPDHAVTFDAPCRGLAEGRTLPLASLVLRPHARGGESLLGPAPSAFTELAGPGGGDTVVPVSLEDEGQWTLAGDLG